MECPRVSHAFIPAVTSDDHSLVSLQQRKLVYKHAPPPCSSTDTLSWQVSTTKGTGGDVIILEEAAYVNPGFFYETVAPLLSIGSAVCAAISLVLLLFRLCAG